MGGGKELWVQPWGEPSHEEMHPTVRPSSVSVETHGVLGRELLASGCLPCSHRAAGPHAHLPSPEASVHPELHEG